MTDFFPLNEYATDLTRFSIDKNLYALLLKKKITVIVWTMK